MADVLSQLAELICQGLSKPDVEARPLLNNLFESRYHKRFFAPSGVRDAFKLASDEDNDKGVPFAGLIHPESPPSGPYGGMSVVWFPTQTEGSLLGLVVGTRGLSPDEGILTRPGHRRRTAALRRYLAKMKVEAWSKPDPAALGIPVPQAVREGFQGFDKALKRYGSEMYCIAWVPRNSTDARKVVQAFFDLYAYERGWEVRKEFKEEYDSFLGRLEPTCLSVLRLKM